ncbi:hypothetical protein PROFUN_05849 [Planoprotostelium fungivorum]|uniref:Uncharacterized protein n=1 Tax=Planoprotostelium fungivorum TaxID=1890364 RepID=A0A2P6NKM6_9EUKA|nr:hypothetical protein PROFUN_05849 [Planoprotostelium fungivorum]
MLSRGILSSRGLFASSLSKSTATTPKSLYLPINGWRFRIDRFFFSDQEPREVPWMEKRPYHPIAQQARRNLRSQSRLYKYLLAGVAAVAAIEVGLDQFTEWGDKCITSLSDPRPEDMSLDVIYGYISFSKSCGLLSYRLDLLDKTIAILQHPDLSNRAYIMALYNIILFTEGECFTNYAVEMIPWDIVLNPKYCLHDEESMANLYLLLNQVFRDNETLVDITKRPEFKQAFLKGLETKDTTVWEEFSAMYLRMKEKNSEFLSVDMRNWRSPELRIDKRYSEISQTTPATEIQIPIVLYASTLQLGYLWALTRWNAHSFINGYWANQFFRNMLIRAPLSIATASLLSAVLELAFKDTMRRRNAGETRTTRHRKAVEMMAVLPIMWLVFGLVPYSAAPYAVMTAVEVIDGVETLLNSTETYRVNAACPISCCAQHLTSLMNWKTRRNLRENSATKKHIQCTFIERELLGFLWYEIILYKQRLIELFGSYVVTIHHKSHHPPDPLITQKNHKYK